MASCKLYCLEETTAPPGYRVAQPTWILLKGNAPEEQYEQAMNKAKSLLDADTEITSDAEIWVYDAPLEGKATIKANKVLKGGTFREGQFSFTLKDAEGKVLQTVTNNDKGNVSFDVKYNKAESIPTPSPRSSPRVPSTMLKITSPMTRPRAKSRLR